MRVAGQTVLALDTTTKRDTVFTPFNQAKSLKIFPNPAREQFTVLLGDKDYGTIDIIAINGKIMKTYQVQRKSDNETIVDCADLPPGAYIVVFRRFNHDVLSGRVIIIK